MELKITEHVSRVLLENCTKYNFDQCPGFRARDHYLKARILNANACVRNAEIIGGSSNTGRKNIQVRDRQRNSILCNCQEHYEVTVDEFYTISFRSYAEINSLEVLSAASSYVCIILDCLTESHKDWNARHLSKLNVFWRKCSQGLTILSS